MNIHHPDIVVRYLKTKNKIRKITTYRSLDCELRNYHSKLKKFLEQRFVPSIFAKGYVKNRSIYQNALSHMYNDYFVMFDIKNFFRSICLKQLTDKIFYEINLREPNQISKSECIKLVDACSVSGRGIPLGFLTSPILSNIYLKDFDNIFYGHLKKLTLNNTIYTRYADDIVVSFKCPQGKDGNVDECIVGMASDILKRYGLQLNKRKTHFYSMYRSNHVKITGINIVKNADERKLTVGRALKNQLYWDALNCIDARGVDEVRRIKGLQSYVLSIEKNGYESCYSQEMINRLHLFGYADLKSLIDSL